MNMTDEHKRKILESKKLNQDRRKDMFCHVIKFKVNEKKLSPFDRDFLFAIRREAKRFVAYLKKFDHVYFQDEMISQWKRRKNTSKSRKGIQKKRKGFGKAIQSGIYGRVKALLKRLVVSGKATMIPRYYATTKTCSVCEGKQILSLGDREYVCPSCGVILDRDGNSAMNMIIFGRMIDEKINFSESSERLYKSQVVATCRESFIFHEVKGSRRSTSKRSLYPEGSSMELSSDSLGQAISLVA